MDKSPDQLHAYFQAAIEEARRPADMWIFSMTVSALLAILIVIATLTNTIVLSIVVLVLIVGLFLARTEQTWLLNNAIKLDGSDYTYIDDIIKENAANLGVSNVSTFTVRDTEDPVFVIGQFNRFAVVFDAEFLEVLNENEARAMLVREIAQVKYRSAELNSFVRPLSEKIKLLGLGAVIKWMFGFWSRRTEATANRLALLYTRDPHTLIMALVKSRLGSRFTELLDEGGLLSQDTQTSGLFRWLAETTSYESFLSTQAVEILKYAEAQNIPISEEARQLLHGH